MNNKKGWIISIVLALAFLTLNSPKVTKDFAMDETAEFIRENYIKSFRLPISLWEENLKFLNTQIEQWLSFQQDYINGVQEFYEKFPGWNGNSKNTDSYFKYPLALQKGYLDSIRSTLDDFTKKNLNLIQKNIEQASSLFDSYFNLFRVHN
jgi:cyclopropane fatty-acyl-phospholipid synthase-like methyltransferase